MKLGGHQHVPPRCRTSREAGRGPPGHHSPHVGN
jgi:hypothetical protein